MMLVVRFDELPVIHILVTDISHGGKSKEDIKGPPRANYLILEHYRDFSSADCERGSDFPGTGRISFALPPSR